MSILARDFPELPQKLSGQTCRPIPNPRDTKPAKVSRTVKGEVKRCELPGCTQTSDGPYAIDDHHIKTRGSGGTHDLKNRVFLCRPHHNDAHAGRIKKSVLVAIAEAREGEK